MGWWFLDEMGFLDFAGSTVAFGWWLHIGRRTDPWPANWKIQRWQSCADARRKLADCNPGVFILWLDGLASTADRSLQWDSGDVADVSRIFATNAAAAGGAIVALILTRCVRYGDLTMVLNGALAVWSPSQPNR